MLSPLRYPGAKGDFASTVAAVIEYRGLTGCKFIEPYCGSATVSLSLVETGVVATATLIERDPLMYSFWKALFLHTDELVSRFQQLPITLGTWRTLRHLLSVETPTPANLVDLGLAALFFNRTNFSGILDAGPIGGVSQNSLYTIDCRTNKDEIIARLLTIAAFDERIDVRFGDAVEFIDSFPAARRSSFFYLDPPYYVKGKSLYRHYYDLPEHKALSRALKKLKTPWLLSYDVHHVIEFLYDDCFVNKVAFRYSARSPKNHDELLISNFEIPQKLLG